MSENMMKAALWYAPFDVRIEEIPIPEVDEDSVLIKTKVSLTCGTDVKTFKRGYPGKAPGTLIGHEIAGDIVKMGKNVRGFAIGDRVVSHNTAPCGVCYACKRGRNDGSCDNKTYIEGGHCEYVLVPGPVVKMNMFKIPDNISYKEAALVEPLSCAVYAADMTPTSVGDTVAILGAGPIGLMAAQIFKKKGCIVIHADLSAERLEVSKRIGTDIQVNLNGVEDPIAAIRAVTPDGLGPDVVVEAVGSPATWEQATKIVRKAGFVNLYGGCAAGTSFNIDTYRVHYEGLTVAGFFHTTPKHVKMAFDLICRKEIHAEEMVTGEYPFERIVDALKAHGDQKGIKNAIIYK